MEQEPVEYPVDGVLDLHQFKPGEARSVLEEYLDECRRAGVLRVRIIHGKGTGTLRRLVHAFLKSCPSVREFTTPADVSGWGATIAYLEPTQDKTPMP
ncbi:Smr/MutS family protein [Candidatus Latescibacterota bacterium]